MKYNDTQLENVSMRLGVEVSELRILLYDYKGTGLNANNIEDLQKVYSLAPIGSELEAAAKSKFMSRARTKIMRAKTYSQIDEADCFLSDMKKELSEEFCLLIASRLLETASTEEEVDCACDYVRDVKHRILREYGDTSEKELHNLLRAAKNIDEAIAVYNKAPVDSSIRFSSLTRINNIASLELDSPMSIDEIENIYKKAPVGSKAKRKALKKLLEVELIEQTT